MTRKKKFNDIKKSISVIQIILELNEKKKQKIVHNLIILNYKRKNLIDNQNVRIVVHTFLKRFPDKIVFW